MTDSHVIARESCPKCGSRDNLARYSDGHAYCFGMGCEYFEPGDNDQVNDKTSEAPGADFIYGEVQAIPARKLTLETCEKWNYQVGKHNGKPVQIANFCDERGVLQGQKLRTKDKKFQVIGTVTDILGGRHLWRDGGRRVIITEGELDALSVSQVLEHKWQVVTLPNGAQSARKTLAANLEWLNKFDKVVLCFDQDDAGRAAVEDCVKLFPPGKLQVVSLPLKDANEMLLAGREEELIRCLWDAKEYRPDGIVTLADVRKDILKPVEMGLPWCLPTLTNLTYGRRYGEAVALGAGVGMGKTTLLTQQIMEDVRAGHSVGAFLFEQLPTETVRRIAGQSVGKTFHIPDGSWTDADLASSLDGLERGGPLHLYDHFGACEWGTVKERIRYLHHAHGTRLFYLDHLTALAAAEEDERRGLEKIMAEMGLLVKQLDIWLLFISHLATPEGTSHEEGGRVMAKHFKGSRAIMQWAHYMIGMERNSQADDEDERGRTTLRILKDRYTGRSNGHTFDIAYDPSTGLLNETGPKPEMPPWTEEKGNF